jgi:hypothetical protein
MGMIAFYAGLFVGILFGCLISSLWAFSLARNKVGVQPDHAGGLTAVDLPGLEAGHLPSPGPHAVNFGAQGWRSPEPGLSTPRLDPPVILAVPPGQQPLA